MGSWCNMPMVFIIYSLSYILKENKLDESWTKQRKSTSRQAVTGLWSYLTRPQGDWLWCSKHFSQTTANSPGNNCQTIVLKHLDYPTGRKGISLTYLFCCSNVLSLYMLLLHTSIRMCFAGSHSPGYGCWVHTVAYTQKKKHFKVLKMISFGFNCFFIISFHC